MISEKPVAFDSRSAWELLKATDHHNVTDGPATRQGDVFAIESMDSASVVLLPGDFGSEATWPVDPGNPTTHSTSPSHQLPDSLHRHRNQKYATRA